MKICQILLNEMLYKVLELCSVVGDPSLFRGGGPQNLSKTFPFLKIQSLKESV